MSGAYVVDLVAHPLAGKRGASTYIGEAVPGRYEQSDFALPPDMARQSDGGLLAFERLMRDRLARGGRSLARGSPHMPAEWWRERLRGWHAGSVGLLCLCGRVGEGKCHGGVLVKLADEIFKSSNGPMVKSEGEKTRRVGGNEGLFGELKETRYV